MTFLELFSGAGGAHLGLVAAGHTVVRAVEWNEDAAATIRATGAEVYTGDVRHSDAYLGLPPVDALWASPPCQDWSSAGKREGANGSRNGWPWTLDAIDFLRATGRGPTWALFENVSGMLHHKGGCTCPYGDATSCPAGYFHRWILPELRKRFAWVDFRVLDAADYSVPQHRNRVFIVCGPVEYRWPKPTHASPEVAASPIGRLLGLQPWRTVRQALGDIGTVMGGGTRGHGMAEWRPRDVTDAPAATVNAMQGSSAGHFVLRPERGSGMCERHGERPDHSIDAPAPAIQAGSRGSGPRLQLVEDPKHPYATDDAPAPAVRSGGDGHSAPPMWLRTEMTGASSSDEPAPTVGGKANTYLHATDPGTRAASEPHRLDMPAPAIMAREVKGTTGDAIARGRASAVQCASDALWLATGRRRLTTAECAALQSFPPDYPWQGTQTSIYAQIGNGVPWPLAFALASNLPR